MATNLGAALGNIGLMYQGANRQALSDIDLAKARQQFAADQQAQQDANAVNAAAGSFTPEEIANLFKINGAGQMPPQGAPMPPQGGDLPGAQPVPPMGGGMPPQGPPGAPPMAPPPPSLGGAPGGPAPQMPPQGAPGAPPMAPPSLGPAPQAPQDPFVAQAQAITQSLPPAQRGLFYKNFFMPMMQQRQEAQRTAMLDQLNARKATESHEDRVAAVEERYQAAKMRSEDQRLSIEERRAAAAEAQGTRLLITKLLEQGRDGRTDKTEGGKNARAAGKESPADKEDMIGLRDEFNQARQVYTSLVASGGNAQEVANAKQDMLRARSAYETARTKLRQPGKPTPETPPAKPAAVAVPQAFAADPDGTTYEKDGTTWVKQGGQLVPQ